MLSLCIFVILLFSLGLGEVLHCSSCWSSGELEHELNFVSRWWAFSKVSIDFSVFWFYLDISKKSTEIATSSQCNSQRSYVKSTGGRWGSWELPSWSHKPSAANEWNQSVVLGQSKWEGQISWCISSLLVLHLMLRRWSWGLFDFSSCLTNFGLIERKEINLKIITCSRN